MQLSQAALRTHASFKQFAVFMESTWLSQGDGPAPGPFPRAGAYYIDHAVAINVTARATWLAWAHSRSISALYIAPHAGNISLISIPGKEGSPAIDKLFCKFVHLCDAQGIDIDLYSDPATDIVFIRNCTQQPSARLQ